MFPFFFFFLDEHRFLPGFSLINQDSLLFSHVPLSIKFKGIGDAWLVIVVTSCRVQLLSPYEEMSKGGFHRHLYTRMGNRQFMVGLSDLNKKN